MLAILDQTLPYLTPSEQAVYLRLWRFTHADDKSRYAVRYEDLAHLAHVSVSILKRVLKKLAQRGLVQVNGKATAPPSSRSTSGLSPPPLLNLGLSPKLYDYFTDDDCSLFLSCKRVLSPQDQKALDQEANGHLFLANVLLFRRCTFGPDRQRHYETLIEHLIQNDWLFW